MRRQVTLLVAATTSLVLVAFLLPLALLVRTLAVDRATAQAVQEAQGLAVAVAIVGDPAQPDALARLDALVQVVTQHNERRITVVLATGRTLGARLPEQSRLLALAASGVSFTADVAGGREVFVPVQTAQGRLVVRAMVPNQLLHRGVARSLLVLVTLGVSLLALGLLVADRLARGTVRPVIALARVTRRLAAGDLSARVDPAGPPEVREVGEAMNNLARRIDDLVAAERETVADLSHRLRTPLTALRLNAEGLRDGRDTMLVRMGVDALERTVDAVIRDARRPLREVEPAWCDAVTVVGERAAFWQVLAEDQGRTMSLLLGGPELGVRLRADDLAAVIDALLGNVFAHTPEGSALQVRVAGSGGDVQIEVADRGPGFSEAATARGLSGAGSTGLGLDIALRSARAAGGRLLVAGRPGGGSTVALVLPLTAG